MRVIIICGKGHGDKFFCTEIAKMHNVVAVLRPSQAYPSLKKRLKILKRRLRKHGLAYMAIKKLADSPTLLSGWNKATALDEAENSLLGKVNGEYNTFVSPISYDISDVNSRDTIRFLSQFNADVVICLGGPIYSSSLIKSCKLMLNYHTGLSPIYNGAEAAFWSFANKHPYFSGGTLMVMSSAIDGGDILAHYLAPIDENDNPATLFLKSIKGGVILYDGFLRNLKSNKRFVRLPQSRPLFYYKSIDWTIYQSLSVQMQLDQGLCKNFIRDEEIVEYWNMKDFDSAKLALRKKILRLVLDNES